MSSGTGSNELGVQFIANKNEALLRKTLHRLTLWDDVLITAKRKLVLAHLEKHEQLTSLGYITKLTNDIQTGVFKPTRNKLRIELVTLENSIEELRRKSLENDFDNNIKHFVKATIMQIFHKLREKAKWHQDNRLECWQMLLRCAEARVYHCHLLLVLLVGEKQKLNDVGQLLQEYGESLTKEFQQLTERIDKMNAIDHGQAHDPRDGKESRESVSLEKMLMSLLAPTQTLHKDEQLLDAFKGLEDSIHSDEQMLLHTSFQAMDQTLTKNLQSFQVLVKLLFSGPTKKPMIVDSALSHDIYDIVMSAKELKERLQALVDECEVVKSTKMSNKYTRIRRLLWVHFLTKYERIDEFIGQMEQALLKKNVEQQDNQ